MMSKIRDLAIYFCRNHKDKEALSKARLNKLIYLTDWKSCLENKAQVTSVSWRMCEDYGPYVPEIVEELLTTGDFELENAFNDVGRPKQILRIKPSTEIKHSLSAEDELIANFVLGKTEPLEFADFLKLVYSTYPVAISESGELLDLKRLAEEYKNKSKLFSPT